MVAVVVVSGFGGCARGTSTTLVSSAPADAEPTTTTEPTTAMSTAPPSTTTTAIAAVRPARVTVPTVPRPAVTVTVPTLPVTAVTAPLPVPELFDVRQGFGTPCDAATPNRPAGCFFFVYATTATAGRNHRLYSDAPFRTDYTLPASGNECGTANPHHADRESCHWYIGPVADRTTGQQECFWLTTVEGTRESLVSNHVCMIWTDQ